MRKVKDLILNVVTSLSQPSLLGESKYWCCFTFFINFYQTVKYLICSPMRCFTSFFTFYRTVKYLFTSAVTYSLPFFTLTKPSAELLNILLANISSLKNNYLDCRIKFVFGCRYGWCLFVSFPLNPVMGGDFPFICLFSYLCSYFHVSILFSPLRWWWGWSEYNKQKTIIVYYYFKKEEVPVNFLWDFTSPAIGLGSPHRKIVTALVTAWHVTAGPLPAATCCVVGSGVRESVVR